LHTSTFQFQPGLGQLNPNTFFPLLSSQSSFDTLNASRVSLDSFNADSPSPASLVTHLTTLSSDLTIGSNTVSMRTSLATADADLQAMPAKTNTKTYLTALT